jgi:hypothetical protein
MRLTTWDNPVVIKEFRGRMRGARAYWLLFGYLLLLSLTLFVAYLQWWDTHMAQSQLGGGAAGFTIGRTFYLTLFYVQAVLITLITPALTAGAISLEREQRTFEMLRATTLSPRSIALGKLASSVAFVVLLLTSSLPLVSLCFLLGGVSPGEVFSGYLLLVADAFLFGAVGLAWSAHAANTATATALSYGTVFLWFIATFPPAIQNLNPFNRSPLGFGAVNPIGAVAGAVVPERYYGWTVAGWIPALLLIVVLGTLLMLACINRLEDDPAHRAVPLRIAALVFLCLALFLGNGIIFRLIAFNGIGFFSPFLSLRVVFLIALCTVILFVPVFVTGEPVWGTWRRPWIATLPSGLPFALVMTCLVSGLMFLAVSLSHLRGTISVLWSATAFLLAVTVGAGGVGLLFSALFRSRWISLTALTLLMTLAVVIPYFSYATLNGRDAAVAAASPAINTLYLSPWTGLAQLGDSVAPNSSFHLEYPAVSGLMGFWGLPIWGVTAGFYFIVGVICYGVGRKILRHQKPSILGGA